MGIGRHSKIVLNIAIGKRDQTTTDVFLAVVYKLADEGMGKSRLKNSLAEGGLYDLTRGRSVALEIEMRE